MCFFCIKEGMPYLVSTDDRYSSSARSIAGVPGSVRVLTGRLLGGRRFFFVCVEEPHNIFFFVFSVRKLGFFRRSSKNSPFNRHVWPLMQTGPNPGALFGGDSAGRSDEFEGAPPNSPDCQLPMKLHRGWLMQAQKPSYLFCFTFFGVLKIFEVY